MMLSVKLTPPSHPHCGEPPRVSDAAVRLSPRVLANPMVAAHLVHELADQARTLVSTPWEFRRLNLRLAAVEHFVAGRPELAMRDMALAQEPKPPAAAMVGRPAPIDRPYVGYDVETNLIWGAGNNLWEAQARAGWMLIEAGIPHLMAHLRWMPAGPGMLEAVQKYGADVPWTRSWIGQAVPEAGWAEQRERDPAPVVVPPGQTATSWLSWARTYQVAFPIER